MTKNAKIATIVVVLLAFIGIMTAGIVAIVKNDGVGQPDDIGRTEKLATPPNLAIDDDWILTFDKVAGAIGYSVLIDGQNSEIVKSNSLDVGKYATVGNHSFAVRAMHSLSSFHSNWSATITRAKYLTLDTPAGVALSASKFSWGSVQEAKSYLLLIEATDGSSFTQRSATTEYDLSNYLAEHPDVMRFTVKVKATAFDSNTESGNEFIRDSEYSEPRTYIKPGAYVTPVLTANFENGGQTQKGDARSITWAIDVCSSEYQVWFGGEQVDTITREDFAGKASYTLDLSQYQKSDTVGEHTVHIVAIPEQIPGLSLSPLPSNQLSYSVYQKLDTVDSETVIARMDGHTLVVTWGEVLLAGDYTIELEGRATSGESYHAIETKEGVLGTTYSLTLGNEFGYQDVRARVRACAQESQPFMQDADFCDWSGAFSTVTKLNSVGTVTIQEGVDDSLVATWAGQNANQANFAYVGHYYCKIYSISESGGDIVRVDAVDFILPKEAESVVLSDKLQGKPAGRYSLTITTMPSADETRFFTASDPTGDAIFDYKTRIAKPTSLNCVREFASEGVSAVKFSFYGVVDAVEYRLTISGENLETTTVTIPQPAGYTSGQIVDTVQVQSVLGAMISPSVYSLELVAVASTQDGKNLMDSNVASLSYTDVFKHASVDADSIQFTKNGDKIVASWAPVATATQYEITLGAIHLSTTASSIDVTNVLSLGQNNFMIYCQEIAGMYQMSFATTKNYTYTHQIVGTADIEYTLIDDAGVRKAQISIDHFDSRIEGYAISFGTGEPQMMTLEDSRAVFVATIEGEGADLPLYETTTVTVFAGVKSVTGGTVDKQDFIQAYQSISTQITNDFDITAPVLAVDNETKNLSITLEPKSLAFVQKVDYAISLNGRLMKSGTIVRAQIYNDANGTAVGSQFVFNLRTLIKGADEATLDEGMYHITANILSTAGISASAQSVDYLKKSKLAQVDGFEKAGDNSYLQWNAVLGADTYIVTVTHNGTPVSGATMSMSEEVVEGREVIRLNTLSLFDALGVGNYVFAVIAHSDDANVTDSTASQYTWSLTTTLVQPNFEVLVYTGSDVALQNKVCAKILVQPLAEKFVITVNTGEPITVNIGDTTAEMYVFADLNITTAGRYNVKVQAVRDEDSSEASVIYIHTAPAKKPTNVTATQFLEQNKVVLTSDAVVANIMNFDANGDATTSEVPLNVEARLCTLTGQEYQQDGQTVWFDLSATAEGGLSVELDSNALAWLNGQAESTFLVFFRTKAYVNMAICEGEILTTSGEVTTRLAFQHQLSTPSFTFEGDDSIASADGPIYIVVSDLDSNANSCIDIEITSGDSTKIVSAKTVNADNKVQITADMLDNTRGEYYVRIRATSNGIYIASPWSEAKTAGCATPIAKVSGMQFGRTFETASGSETVTRAHLVLKFNGIEVTGVNVNYAVSMNFVHEGNQHSFVLTSATADSDGKVKFALDYTSGENTAILRTVLGSTVLTDLSLNFVIVATPSGEGATLYTASTTNYTYTVGQMSAPTNFVFTQDGENVTVTWDADANYSDPYQYVTTYTYNLSIKDGSGNATTTRIGLTATSNTVTFGLPSGYASQAYIVNFEITKSEVQQKYGSTILATFTGSAGSEYVSQVTTGNATLSVDYDPEAERYTGTITHDSDNTTLFTGQTYSVSIAGSVVATDLTTNTFTLTESVVARLIASAGGQTADYTITISDNYYQANTYQPYQTLVAYKGKDCTGSVTLPLVVDSVPTHLTFDPQTAEMTMTNIPYVTKYSWSIVPLGSTTVSLSGTFDCNATATTSTVTLASFAGLNAGQYTLRVKAEAVEASKIYVKTTDSARLNFEKFVAHSAPENATFVTKGNMHGDFETVLSWKLDADLDASRFAINFVSVSTGTSYAVDMSKVGMHFESAPQGSKYVYALTFKGLDLIDDTDLGYDPTRTMPIGDYRINIRVFGQEAEYSTASSVVEFADTYQNKFGVTQVNAEAFAIAPECFFGESNVQNGQIIYDDTQSAMQRSLANYEAEYGFNRKYLVITQSGMTQNRATNYRIWINGNDVGMLDKNSTVTTLDFDSISTATKQSLGNLWRAGTNQIKLMPYTSSDMLAYYYYVDGLNAYQLDADAAIDRLTAIFDVKMYSRFGTPSDPRVELGYSDVAMHNINKVNVSFANSSNSDVYSVVVKYQNYYDSEFVNTYATLDDMRATFSGSQNVGIQLYDYIKAIGPHAVWFEIRQTGSSAITENSEYYLCSNMVTTDSFIYTTALQEFATSAVPNQNVSIVTEIDSFNQDTNVEYQTNGHLKWNLPVNAYSMTAQYTVSLKDINNKVASKVAQVLLTVDNGDIAYTLVHNDNGLFYIDSDYIYFDMTQFFWNNEEGLSGQSRAPYYIAGEYYYQITAKALDKNRAEATGRIYDPSEPTFGYKKFVYKNITYPVAPKNAVVDKDGVLSWVYNVQEEFDTSTNPAFMVKIVSKVSGTKTVTELLGPTTQLSMDIASYLVAGGSNTNTISVCRVAPNEYYLDSEFTEAAFAEDYSANATMPEIEASWTTKYNIDYQIVADSATVDNVFDQLSANGSGAKFVISLLRVANSDEGSLAENATFDTVVAMTDLDYTQIIFDDIVFNIADGVSETGYSYNLLNAIQAQGKTAEWLDGANFIAGRYFVKVEFVATEHPYFDPAVANIVRDTKSVWTVVSEENTSLTGEYLTTKSRTQTTATPQNNNDRKWAEAEVRDAVLGFDVYAITDKLGTKHLPDTVTVRVKLWDGTAYTTDKIFEYEYTLPSLSILLADTTATSKVNADGDVEIRRVTGTTDYYSIRINIHKLFDITEDYAGDLAGVYHLEYILNEDEFGSASDALHSDGTSWYAYARDICHYVAIPTPILDYRLDLQENGANYAYVLNWALTPNPFTHKVDDIDYNVNIYAFQEKTDGTFACDTAYTAQSSVGKQLFLQNETAGQNQASSYGFAIEKVLRNFDTVYQIDGRRCYINKSSTSGLDLVPNKKYKFFIYLTPSADSGDANAQYYLSSATSIPQEYTYKAISSQHYGSEITPIRDGEFAVEGQDDFLNAKVYDILSNQDARNYNNGFELFIYDTQDSSASSSSAWMLDQEANKTYLAHFIITTLDNVASNGNRVPLYVVDGSQYIDGKNVPLQYLCKADGSYRQVGTIRNSAIEINDLTIAELLGEKAYTPITYYCKIKSWIDNNEVNANAPVSTDGMLQDVEIYGEDWVRKYITTDEALVAQYVQALNEQGVNKVVKKADFNALNPSYYFTFQHTIRFADPTISKVEFVNNGSASDVSGECVVEYSSTNTGVTAGYIVADSTGDYSIKIYLDNVYNSETVFRQDKFIRLTVSTYGYEQSTDGTIDFDRATLSEAKTVTLRVIYDGEESYVLLNKSSEETNAVAIFNYIDSQLPNKIYFTATAVSGNSDLTQNAGGANTANKFVPSLQDTNKSSAGYGNIERAFATSGDSPTVSIIVKKQYSAPQISFRFDDSVTKNLVSSTATESSTNGAITNVLADGDYAGLALNPYLYVDGADYASIGAQGGADGYEYIGLSNRADTMYEVVFGYQGRTVTYTFKTKDINTTLTQFAQAVNKNSTRFDYNKHEDVYPYEVACLYQKLYQLINSGNSAGDYHGGKISAKIRVLAPSDVQKAGYWVTSDYRDGAGLDFYVRLETVRTSFDADEAQFADPAGEYHRATMYANKGYYYYYQGYIPFHYQTIAKNVNYRVTLTRPNVESVGNFVYSYDTLYYAGENAQLCQWSPSSNGDNIGNLADILAVDMFTSNDPDRNQWMLERNWSINIVAYADATLQSQFVARGFDSEARTYSPKLQIVNDITGVNITMDVDKSAYTVGKFATDNIAISTNSATKYNLAAGKAIFTYNVGNGLQETTIDIKQNIGATCYTDMIYDFIENVFISDPSIIGNMYHYSVRLFNDINNVVESEEKINLVFEYYKQIKITDFSASVEQSSNENDFVDITASIGQASTITGMSVKLHQTVLGTNAEALSAQKALSRSTSGSDYHFDSTWSFDMDYADCFTDEAFSSSNATRLTQNGYVTSANKGYLQAGVNTFRFYPVQDPQQATYNLWRAGTYFERNAEFVVPSSFAPSIELEYTTSSEGGENEYGERYKNGRYYYRDLYKTAYYVYVDGVQATVSNGSGYEVNATWTYGWKKKSGETACTKTEFTANGSATSMSTACNVTLAQKANFVNYSITLSAKSGFEDYFVTPSVQKQISADTSAQHTERTFIRSVQSGIAP